MSLWPKSLLPIPEEIVRVADAAFSGTTPPCGSETNSDRSTTECGGPSMRAPRVWSMMRPWMVALTIVGWGPAVSSNGDPGRPAGPKSAAEAPGPPASRVRILDFRVVDARDGTPLPDVSIVVLAAGMAPATNLATDGDGHCRITFPVRARRYVGVSARKEGFVPVRVVWRGPDLDAGLPESYTLAIEPGRPIGGVVRDTRGGPIAGAKVYIYLQSKGFRNEREQVYLEDGYYVETDAQGRWRFAMMPDHFDEGENRPILAFRLTHPDFESEPLAYERRLSTVALRELTGLMVMEDGVPLTGRVVNSRGLPVGKARVFLQTPGILYDPALLRPEQMAYLLTESEADGRFLLGHIKPGGRWVRVEARGYAPRNAQIDAGATPEPTEIRLATTREMEEAGRLAVQELERSAAASRDESDDVDRNGAARDWLVIGILVALAVVCGASLISWLWSIERPGG